MRNPLLKNQNEGEQSIVAVITEVSRGAGKGIAAKDGSVRDISAGQDATGVTVAIATELEPGM